MFKRGFTAVEVLLTIGVIGITAGVSVPMYRNYQIRSDLDLAVVQTLQGLSRAQLLSQTGQEDGIWGFSVEEGTVFLGESYAVRDSDFDEIIELPTSVSVYGITEVSFSRVEGIPSPTGDIIFEALSGETRTITVSTDGALVAGGIEEPDYGEDGEGSEDGEDAEESEDSEDGGGDTSGDIGGDTGGDDGGSSDGDDTGGSDDEEGGSSGGGDEELELCQDRFSVSNNGTIRTTGSVNLTVKALGSAITYGTGGPEVEVKAKISTDGGSSWTELFDDNDIDGGEEQVFPNLTEGENIVIQIRGRYGWLFNKTFESNDGSKHIEVLRNGDSLPDYDSFDNQQSLATFLRNVLDENGRISIGEYDVILLTELGALSSSASDFQDAVLLLQFAQNEGSCAASSQPHFTVEWERLENSGKGDAEKKLFVGHAAWAYGENQAVPLLSPDGQVATDGGISEDMAGLAVQRENGFIRIRAHGSHNNNNSKEIVDARITLHGGSRITGIVNEGAGNKSENPFDGIVNDGSGGDEATIAYGSGSALFQTRVTTGNDGVLVYWGEYEESEDLPAGEAGAEESEGGEDAEESEDTEGEVVGDDIADEDSDTYIDPCAAEFVVNNGQIVLQESADVSFRVLGSHATYGEDGPEVDVRMNVSTNGGSTWQSLFGFRDIDGGERQSIRDIPSGSAIVLQTEGRRGWLFRQQTTAGDGSNRLRVLRRNDADPQTTIFSTPSKLKTFLRNRIEDRKIRISSKEALVLVELQTMDGSADYQDAAVLVTIEKPASRGICGAVEEESEDGEESEGGEDAEDAEESEESEESEDGEDTSADDPEIQICHYPPGNAREFHTLTISQSAWPAHAAHGDRRGPCEGDDDGDTVANSIDLCPATYAPEAVPTELMLFKRFALTESSFIFREGPRKKVGEFTLENTLGCSCEQLVNVAEGAEEYRFAQFPSLLRTMRSLFPFYTSGARQYGCSKSMLKIVQSIAR